MAQRKRADRPALEQDALVEALVPDPSPGPLNATVLQGYLGKSTTQGAWRLYLTPELDQFVELPEAEILHSEKQTDDGTLVWVRKDLPLTALRLQAAQVQAEFLGGSVASARLPLTTAAAGVSAPGDDPIVTFGPPCPPRGVLMRPPWTRATAGAPGGAGDVQPAAVAEGGVTSS